MSKKHERKRTIKRLQSISMDKGSEANLNAIALALYGEEPPTFGWTMGACELLREHLVWLLSN